nr:Uncharacterised protein [Salmonella sp. NCTC 7297]
MFITPFFVFFCVLLPERAVFAFRNPAVDEHCRPAVTLLAGVAIIKFGPSRLYVFAYTLMILCLAGLFMVYQFPTDNKVTILVVLAALYQVGRCVLEFTPWNVFPFIRTLMK